MSTHFTRTAAALLTAVMMLAALAGTMLAAPTDDRVSFAERGITAQAFWESCDGPDADGVTHCTGTQLFVFDGRQRSNDEFGRNNAALAYLCVNRHEVAFDAEGSPITEPIEEHGCIDDPELTVAGTLDSVTAATTELGLTRLVCTHDPETGESWCEDGPTRTVSVQAAFTGIGSIVSERWISRNHSDADGLRCTFFSSGKGIQRDASATMTINGSPLGPSAFAMLSDGKMSFSQTCR